MNWHTVAGGLLLALVPGGCIALHPPAALPESPEKGLIGDSFVPAPDGTPRTVTVVVEDLPPLPATGPIELTRSDCQERARRAGRLGGESVQAMYLDFKVGELDIAPLESPYTIDSLRAKIGLGYAASVGHSRAQVAKLEYLKRLDCLVLAVDRACWTFQSALRTNALLVARNAPLDVRVAAEIECEEARVALGQLLALTPDQAARLVLVDVQLPSLPADIEAALCAVPELHPDLAIARLKEDILRETRHAGDGDLVVEHRQRWLRSQQAIADTRIHLTDRGATLLRHWRQAQRLLEARRQPAVDLTPLEQIHALQAICESERKVGLAQIELAHWLRQSAIQAGG